MYSNLRMNVLWGESRCKVKNDLKLYDDMILICASLTNFHISRNPLRAVDSQNHRRISLSSSNDMAQEHNQFENE